MRCNFNKHFFIGADAISSHRIIHTRDLHTPLVFSAIFSFWLENSALLHRLFSIRSCLHTTDCIHYAGYFFLYADFHDRLLHRKSFFCLRLHTACHKTTAKINLRNVTSHTQIWYLGVVFLYYIPVSYYVLVRLWSRILLLCLLAQLCWPSGEILKILCFSIACAPKTFNTVWNDTVQKKVVRSRPGQYIIQL